MKGMNMAASALPYGNVKSVNQERYGSQGAAQVAALPDGGYVAVWVNYDAQGEGLLPGAGNAASDIRMRLFNTDGTARGPEIAVNNRDRGWQVDPDVAVTPDGSIAVTWTDGWGFWGGADHPGSDTEDLPGSQAAMARFFSPHGQALGAQVLVNQTTANDQRGVSVAALESGRFLMAWEDWSLSCNANGCGGGPGIKARVYGADGQALGSEQVWTGSWCFSPSPEALAGGGAAHIWLDGYYYDSAKLVVRLHDAAGGALGSEVVQAIGGQGAGAQWSADGLSDGGLVLAWTHRDPASGDGDGSGIRARLVNADGAPRGDTFVVNGTTTSEQSQVRVAALDGGGFVAVWQTRLPADATRGDWTLLLRAQVFDAQGQRMGSEVAVSGEDQSLGLSDLVGLDGGGFAVAWTGRGWVDTHVRAFDANGQSLGDTVVVHEAGGHQSQARLAALQDGRFSVTWLAASDGYSGGDGSVEGIQTRSFATRGLNLDGGNDADALIGTPLADRIGAGAGNDIVHAWGGADRIDGGAGVDTLVLPVTTADVLQRPADFVFQPGQLARLGSSLGTVDLTGIERVRLDDGLYAIDTTADGKAFQAAALWQAAFGQLPTQPELSRWTAVADGSADMRALAAAMLDSYAPPNLSNADLVAHLYTRLVGEAPTAEVVTAYAAQIGADKTWASQADVFAWAASLDLNVQAMVDDGGVSFVGSIQMLDPALWFG
ncbi:MAG: hypothetical protein IPF94_17675 [Betaproteobacteria bacterium]|nr:hypothetical protein [Betaproteobacteria bacterium]